MNSIVARISGEDPRVPCPPGIRRTSSSGAVEKVCVGRMDWPIADGRRGDLVVTGSRVEERTESVILCFQERTLKASNGPKASRAWKPGKRTTPIRVGLEGVRLALGFALGFAAGSSVRLVLELNKKFILVMAALYLRLLVKKKF